MQEMRIYTNVECRWLDKEGGYNTLNLHNITIWDAYLEAEYHGFKPSPWWHVSKKIVEIYGCSECYFENEEIRFSNKDKWVQVW